MTGSPSLKKSRKSVKTSKSQAVRLRFDNETASIGNTLVTKPNIFTPTDEEKIMEFVSRRARIEAEKIARRSQLRRKVNLGTAGLFTIAGATMASLVPAQAALDDVPGTEVSSADVAVGPDAGGISTSSTTASETYTVKSGDTLSKIANAHGTTVNKLVELNNMNVSDIIYPGEQLVVDGAVAQTAAATSAQNTQDAQNASVGPNATGGSGIQTASSTSGVGSSAITQKAINIVNSGATYRLGANGPSQYDCSSLTQTAYRAGGKSIPRVSAAQYAQAPQHGSINNLKEGDLIFWSNNGSASGIYHVALYVGNGKIAQARNPKAGVTVDNLSTYLKYNPPLSTTARY